jgi:hypothetical protein
VEADEQAGMRQAPVVPSAEELDWAQHLDQVLKRSRSSFLTPWSEPVSPTTDAIEVKNEANSQSSEREDPRSTRFEQHQAVRSE